MLFTYHIVAWHEAAGQVMDAARTTELEIVWIAHGWLVLVFIPWPNCEIFIRNQRIFAAENVTNKLGYDTTIALCPTIAPGDNTHAWAYALIRSVAKMHGSRQNTTYWSVCVLSEVYYVLPRLCLCHLSQIVQPNSRNKRVNRHNNVHSVLCLLSDPIILIRT